MHKRGTRAGFTIVEMLVVITITMILMGLIFGPIIGTFNLTRRANAMVEAQDTARSTLEQISREMSQAMFIYDNSNSAMEFPVQQPPASGETAPNIKPLLGLYGKVDLVLPKLVMHCNNPNHPTDQPRDYERGNDAWPTCPACAQANVVCKDDDVEARPLQPLRADTTIVRYFIGLRDNTPYDPNKPTEIHGYRDWPEDGSYPQNGFILYRAEFKIYNDDGTPNKNLFKLDGNNKPIIDDPHFFYDESKDTDDQLPRWQHWKAIARPVGPIKETDLVRLQMNSDNTQIVSVTPSIRFQLSQLTNDAFTPTQMTDEGSEVPNSIPSAFRASYGAWGSSIGDYDDNMYTIMLCRYDPTNPGNNIWYRTRWDQVGGTPHLVIYKYPGETAGFDVTDYDLNQKFDFDTKKPDIAFRVDPVKGEVRFDFPGTDQIVATSSDKDQITIDSMNSAVANKWQSDATNAVRNYRIHMFTFTGGQYQPRIVPGSEIVMGPDMTPGLATDGVKMVRYERVPFNLGDPGPNQYKINYGIDDLTGENVGWMIFSPSHDEPIPETLFDGTPSTINVSYKFQLNRDSDVVLGNYSTKTLMQITLGIRYYDRNSGKLEGIELTNKVRVRNLMR